MYKNIGKKIKKLAKVLTVIGIVACVITGIVLIALGNMTGLVCIFFMPFLVWIGSFFTYAIGELVDKVCDIKRAICGEECVTENVPEDVPDPAEERRNKIEQLRFMGLLTEEEYQRAISKEE